MKILYIEDDELVANSVKTRLEKKYKVDVAADGKTGWDMVKKNHYDLLILDFFLPDTNGLELSKKIRRRDQNIALLMFTSNDDKKSVVDSFNAGADDYLTKPFHFPELEARIKALIKRSKKTKKINKIDKGEIQIDPVNKLITINDKLLNLSEQEYLLFKYILDHEYRVVNRKELHDQIWGEKANLSSNVIEVHIRRIRNKIRKLSDKNYIKSIYGQGYQAVACCF